MARNELVILDPRSQPVRALISAQDAASLGPGEWAQLDNVRLEKGLLTCRGGMAALELIAEDAELRGYWSGYLWGEHRKVVAVLVDSEVRVLMSDGSSDWLEITDDGAQAWSKIGSTRFSDEGGIVRFTVVPDILRRYTEGYEKPNTELLLVADGFNRVRCISRVELSHCLSGIVEDIPPQIDVQSAPVQVRSAASWFDLQSSVSYAASGSDFTLAAYGTNPNAVARVTIKTSISSGDTVTLTRSSGLSVDVSDHDRQLLIGVDTDYPPLWDKLKVELDSEILWDPASPQDYSRPTAVPLDLTQRTVWAFQYPKRSSETDIEDLKLTWVGESGEEPAADFVVDLFLVALTAGVSSSADYSLGVTNYNSFSFTESPGVIYSTYVTQRIRDCGGPVMDEIRMPRSPLIQAEYFAPIKNHSVDLLEKGVAMVNFYVKETGATKYRFWHRETIGTRPSSWEFWNGEEGDTVVVSAGPGSAVWQYEEEYIPDAFHISIPAASELTWANNRLFVGMKKGSTQNILFSQFRNAMRCRQFATFQDGNLVEDSPSILSLDNETITAIVPMATSTVGSSIIYLLTDYNVYAVQGQTTSQLSQVGRVANVGCIAPYSIVGDKGDLYFLDNEMQVRLMRGGQMQSISRQIVDNHFRGIPAARRKWAAAAAFGDRLYVAFTPSAGSANTRIAVWDFARGIWVTDSPPVACAGLLSAFDGSTSKLLALGINGDDLQLYEYDKADQAQDLGTTNITCTLEPYELHSPDGSLFHIGRCKAMIDDLDSAAATVVRTYRPSGVTQTTSMSLDTALEHIYREDRIEGATVVGSSQPVGPRCSVTWAIPLRSGRRIRFLSLKFLPLGGGHDRP